MSKALEDVAAERFRQQSVEGWTTAHDDRYEEGELIKAAVCYSAWRLPSVDDAEIVNLWPWDRAWWKPRDERRNLVRAAALLIAEIERLYRRLQKKETPVS